MDKRIAGGADDVTDQPTEPGEEPEREDAAAEKLEIVEEPRTSATPSAGKPRSDRKKKNLKDDLSLGGTSAYNEEEYDDEYFEDEEGSEEEPSTEKEFEIDHIFSNLPSIASYLKDLGSVSTDTESDVESESSSKGSDRFHSASRSSFFEEIAHVPSVSQISQVSEIKEPPKKPEKSGGFVNPLTGSEEDFVPVVVEEKQQQQPEPTEEIVEEVVEEEEEFSCKEFDAFFEIEEKEADAKQGDEQDILDIMIGAFEVKHDVFDHDKELEEAEEKRRRERLLSEGVQNFLNELLNFVVTIIDQKERAGIFRDKLDKRKIFQTISVAVKDVYVEKSVNSFLTRKSTEYYRRKQQLRFIIPEKVELYQQEVDKYKQAAARLDYLMGRETFTKEKVSNRIEELEKEKAIIEEKEKNEFARLEDFFRTTLKVDIRPRVGEAVRRDLIKMKRLCEELTEVRLVVIQRQHSLATIKAQIEKLQDLGGGLNLIGYQSLQRDTIGIGKKIEERNRELNRLHDSFNGDLHLLAHSKLGNDVKSKRVFEQAQHMNGIVKTKVSIRRYVFDLKKDHQRNTREIQELRMQSGILYSPALMEDYDITVEKVEKQQKVVDELRLTHNKLEQKLKKIEKFCKPQ